MKFTEKDLAYISDMFEWNLEALKLSNHFMNEAKEEEVVEILEEVVDMHYENLRHCIALLNGEVVNDDLEEDEIEDDEEDYEDA